MSVDNIFLLDADVLHPCVLACQDLEEAADRITKALAMVLLLMHKDKVDMQNKNGRCYAINVSILLSFYRYYT
jgi:hypothetical protein